MKFIKRMRSKSNSAKSQYAFFIALFCTVVIAFVWSTTLPARFSSFNTSETAQEAETDDSLTDIFNEAKVQVGNVVNWDETEQSDVTTTNLDGLSERNLPSASTSPDLVLPLEEESGTSTEENAESEVSRRVLIEVRETEVEGASVDTTQGEGSDRHTPTSE